MILLILFRIFLWLPEKDCSTADVWKVLEGHWELREGDRVTRESWKREQGKLTGYSYTLKNNKDTVFMEQMEISEIMETPVLAVRQKGNPPVYFTLVSCAGELVFSNTEHDFPQRIIYRRVSDRELKARIEGEVKGEKRSVDFPYVNLR